MERVLLMDSIDSSPISDSIGSCSVTLGTYLP